MKLYKVEYSYFMVQSAYVVAGDPTAALNLIAENVKERKGGEAKDVKLKSITELADTEGFDFFMPVIESSGLFMYE